jgi:hypothetical protein
VAGSCQARNAGALSDRFITAVTALLETAIKTSRSDWLSYISALKAETDAEQSAEHLRHE